MNRQELLKVILIEEATECIEAFVLGKTDISEEGNIFHELHDLLAVASMIDGFAVPVVDSIDSSDTSDLIFILNQNLKLQYYVSKSLRFGNDSYDPTIDDKLSNREHVNQILTYILTYLVNSSHYEVVLIDTKCAKVEKYLLASKKCGTLSE